MKRFNITAVCIPQKHYMVDISDKLEQMIEMIEKSGKQPGAFHADQTNHL